MSDFTLDVRSTALVSIDLQNAIASRPVQPYPVSQVVERCVQLADAVRARGGTVIFVRVSIAEVLQLPADAPVRDPKAAPQPASASELVPEIQLHPGDLVITKRQWGAFYGTGLEQQLRRKGIGTIILGGVATNFGVESTARAALDRGYELVFAEDAMSSVSAEAHEFATKVIFPRMGRVRSAAAVLQALA